MVTRSSSLAAQLADLGNAAPAEYDLDSDTEALDVGRALTNGKRQGDGDDDDGDADVDAEEEARNHARHNLVDVDRSQMRRRANLIENADDDTMARYRGVKATRREMMGSEDEEDGEDYSESDIASEEDEPEFTDVDDDQDDDDEDLLSGSEEDPEQDSESEGSEFDDGDATDSAKPKKSLRFADAEEAGQSASTSLKATQADAALLADLRQRSRVEAARGRDTKRQLDAWGRLLGARIRVQKVVRGATRISSKAMAKAAQQTQQRTDDHPSLQETQTDVLATLDEISGHLSALQHRLLQAYASANDAGSASVASALHAVEPRLDRAQQQRSAKGKRKLSNAEYDEQLSTLFSVHDSVLGPMWRDVLGKWSWRTASTSAMDDMKKAKTRFDAGAGGNGANGLKAVNQSPEEQIRRGLEGEAFERLRKRTRVWRGTDKESRVVLKDDGDIISGDDEEDEDESPSRPGAEDADIFDDSDFYSALLRELIDSKGGGGGASGSSVQDAQGQLAWAQAANRAAKKHRANVDRKASKGRRLRFDVNEKVQNFMPPIPRETWSEEQIQRLVEQLRSANGGSRSQNGAHDIADGDDEKQDSRFPLEKQAVAVEMNGFRLF